MNSFLQQKTNPTPQIENESAVFSGRYSKPTGPTFISSRSLGGGPEASLVRVQRYSLVETQDLDVVTIPLCKQTQRTSLSYCTTPYKPCAIAALSLIAAFLVAGSSPLVRRAGSLLRSDQRARLFVVTQYSVCQLHTLLLQLAVIRRGPLLRTAITTTHVEVIYPAKRHQAADAHANTARYHPLCVRTRT